MATNRTRVVSNFRAVKTATREAFTDAIEVATNVMEAEAEKRLERIDDTRGYELPIDVKQTSGQLDGRIVYEPFYGRFFEFGTVFIPAAPFMRPAHRKGKRALVKDLADNYEGTVRKRAGVRR